MSCSHDMLCLTLDGGGLCTLGCSGDCATLRSAFADAQCTTIQVTNKLIGLCLPQAFKGTGARCVVSSECKSLICLPSIHGGGYCSEPCAEDAGCAKGMTCGDNACVQAGSLPVGWPCKSGYDCKSSHCISHPWGGFEKVCSQPCELASDCLKGTGCTPTASKPYCLPYGAPMLGSPCTKPGACGPNALCDKSELNGVGTCRASCDPFGNSLDCPEGARCVWVGERSETGGACHASGPGHAPGKNCDANNLCRVDLICAGTTPTDAICRQDCNPSNEASEQASCPSGQVCAPLVDDQGKPRTVGVCATVEEALTEVSPAPVDHELNFAARQVSLPEVKPYVPPPDKPTSETSSTQVGQESGCQSHGRAPSSGTPVIFLLLAVATILHRRRLADPAGPYWRQNSA
jgi:hypothetical protein